MRQIDIEIYDDFVSPTYLKALQDATDPNSTPWYFQGSQSLSRYDDSKIEDFGFSIGLLPPWKPNEWEQIPLADLIRPLVYQISDVAKTTQILRCRLDMTVLHRPPYVHPPHIDVEQKHIAAIVYVNDSDGPTIIYDESANMVDKIEPVKGRALIFSGDTIHASSSPKEHNCRIAINYNFKIDERLH